MKLRAYLLDAPDRTTLVHWTLFANECRRSTGQNPNVVVGRLLAKHGRNHSRDTTEFNVKNEINSVALRSPDCEGNFTRRLDQDVDQTRLLAWCDKGKSRF